MGWDWLEEALDAAEKGNPESGHEKTPMPAVLNHSSRIHSLKGIDWVRDDHGHVKHPLSKRAFDLSLEMWLACQAEGHMEDDGDADLHSMVFQFQMTAANLAGPLDHVGYDIPANGAFIVACLKRSLRCLHSSIDALAKVEGKALIDAARLNGYRKSLFAIRQDILELMNTYRKRTDF